MSEGAGKKLSIGAIALACLFWLPLLSGVLSRVFKQSRWFGDYGAVACAAEKHLQGAPMYDMNLACPDMNVAMYIYHPWVAQGFASALERLGRNGLLTIYAFAFALAVAGLAWIMLGRRGGAPRIERAWFGAFLTGSAIYWGNIAVILHALIGVAATTLRRWPAAAALAIALAMLVKPLFATFACVFLLMRASLLVRLAYAIATVALGLAPSVWLLAQGGALAEQWAALVTHVVYLDRPGETFLGWVALLGGDVGSFEVKIAYVAFAAMMAGAGMVLAEALELGDEERALLALSLGVLLNPRLMSQDFWLLGPGLLALAAAVGARAAGLGLWLQRGLLGVCILALIGNLADLGDYTGRIATFALTLMIAAAACWALLAQRGFSATWRALFAPT